MKACVHKKTLEFRVVCNMKVTAGWFKGEAEYVSHAHDRGKKNMSKASTTLTDQVKEIKNHNKRTNQHVNQTMLHLRIKFQGRKLLISFRVAKWCANTSPHRPPVGKIPPSTSTHCVLLKQPPPITSVFPYMLHVWNICLILLQSI